MTGPEYVSLPGVRLATWTRPGETMPVLVIHGGPGIGSGYLRRHLPDAVPGRWTLHFVDLTGAGLSKTENEAPVSVDRMAEDLQGLLRTRGVEDGLLLGHSFGGLVALALATRAPEHVRGMMLVDPDPPVREDWEEAFRTLDARRTDVDRARLTELEESGAWRASTNAATEYLRRRLRAYAHDASAVDRIRFDLPRWRLTRLGSLDTEVREAAGRWDLRSGLPRIRAPTSIITGPASPYPPEALQALTSGLADANLISIPGTGHFPFLEAPTEFRETVQGFVDRIGSGASEVEHLPRTR